MSTTTTESTRLVVEPIDLATPVEAAVRAFAALPGCAILESSLRNTPNSRYSVFASDPIDEYVHSVEKAGCPIRGLAKHVARYPMFAPRASDLPFTGGWIGFLGYEAGHAIEGLRRTKPDEATLPLARFRLYDTAAVFDHHARQWILTAVDWPDPIARRRPTVAARLGVLRKTLESVPDHDLATKRPEPIAPLPEPNMTREAYFSRVARAKRYIEAGDIYQVNLTQRFTATVDLSPLELYLRLRDSSPSPQAALLPWEPYAVLSASPELFLDLRNGHVVTRPIKGTRPRTGHPSVDARHRRELNKCEKERAELNMIIDLMRNDLGRVCVPGSVRVVADGEIEEHPTVVHRVATVEGDLTPGRNWLDLLLATFPGGSITGAPKIRAMQIIAELEPTPREVYCGSIGWIGLDGSMSLNIAIRTMVQSGNTVHAYAGGAIVADSVAQREYDELLTKARGMFNALGCVHEDRQGLRERVMAS